MRTTPIFTAPLASLAAWGLFALSASAQDWSPYAHAPRSALHKQAYAEPVHYTLDAAPAPSPVAAFQEAVSYGPPVRAEAVATGCDTMGDAACCPPCCEPCCGPFTVRVGAVYVQRGRADDIPLVVDNFGGGPTALSAGQYDFDYRPGVDTSLIYDGGRTPWAIETRFLWIDDWTTSRNVMGLNNAGIATTPTTNLFGATVESSYRSELESLEINLRREIGCGAVTLLSGMRYITFNERLDLNFDAFSQNRFTTGNELLGYQIGGEAVLYENCCGLRIESFGKAGVYGNNGRVGVMLQQIEQEPVSESSGMDHVAFFGELGLFASYELAPCWRLRAGYQVMWLDGVLVAANQVPQTDNTGMVIGFDYTDVVYHGALLSLEANW